jgi:hypothetical protein
MTGKTLLLAALALVLAGVPAYAAKAPPPDPRDAPPPPCPGGKEPCPDRTGAPDAGDADEAPPTDGGGPSLVPPRTKATVELPTRTDPDTGREVIVITNDVLEQMFGKTGARRTPSGGAPASPAASHEQRSAATRKLVAERIGRLEQQLARLRKKALSIRNPFLPRVPLTDEEKAREAGLDNTERLALTQARIEQLEQELRQLRERSEASSP